MVVVVWPSRVKSQREFSNDAMDLWARCERRASLTLYGEVPVSSIVTVKGLRRCDLFPSGGERTCCQCRP